MYVSTDESCQGRVTSEWQLHQTEPTRSLSSSVAWASLGVFTPFNEITLLYLYEQLQVCGLRWVQSQGCCCCCCCYHLLRLLPAPAMPCLSAAAAAWPLLRTTAVGADAASRPSASSTAVPHMLPLLLLLPMLLPLLPQLPLLLTALTFKPSPVNLPRYPARDLVLLFVTNTNLLPCNTPQDIQHGV